MSGVDEKSWLLWQLADSAFPTGGFAHSAGLEAAWQQGEVRDAAELSAFAEASLWQLSWGALPFVRAVHQEPSQLADVDRHCDAFITSHAANRASRLQGRALLASGNRIFSGLISQLPPHSHLAPVFGALTAALQTGLSDALELFSFQHLRGLLAAAVRLGITGPMEAQAMQHRLAPRAREIIAAGADVAVSEVAQTAPLLELWQGSQDRLYSRLFQS